MHIVRLEALYWCKTAVPVGVAAGIAGTWILCALLRFGAGAEFVQIPLFESVVWGSSVELLLEF